MTGSAQTAGTSVVGQLTDIAAWEAELIMSMRFWMEGPESRTELWDDFARAFGVAGARTELRRFDTFLNTLCTLARRPLMRHGLGCSCIGADEAVLQTLVREAARGDLAEATLLASLLVPARHAEPIAVLAAEVGHAMQRMVQRRPIPPVDSANCPTRILH